MNQARLATKIRIRKKIASEDIGKKYSRLTVVGVEWVAEKNGTETKRFICSCKCGRSISTRAAHVFRQTTRSCGCLRKGEKKKPPISKSFWDRVVKTEECWLWAGSKNQNGYGVLSNGETTMYAHRFSYEFHKGKIEDGLVVCHKCDVPRCVNPSHLFIGTRRDNALDSQLKGRNAKEEKHGRSKLKANQVKEIRMSTLPLIDIADRYMVSKSHIWAIKRRVFWKELL